MTAPVENLSKDEIGQIGAATNGIRTNVLAALDAHNRTRTRLADIVGEVSGSATQVAGASQQMASTSEESGRATGEIADAVGGIAHGAERQVQMVESARQSTEAMQDLAGKSEQIGQIVQTITGIAEQTNLLALNAAIEAPRAGEPGRGFAVVAEEVRKLAEEAQDAAQEISQLVGAIQGETSRTVDVVRQGAERTHDGASVVERTREAFLRIGGSVDDMAARVEQIAAVSNRIAVDAQSMQDSIGEVAPWPSSPRPRPRRPRRPPSRRRPRLSRSRPRRMTSPATPIASPSS